MEAQPERFAAWLDDQIAACQARQKSLLSDDRGDEAVFEKVRTNVYDICRTLLAVAARTCEGEAAGRFFLLTNRTNQGELGSGPRQGDAA